MINWSLVLALMFGVSAIAHFIEFVVMFHKSITHAITRDELKRTQRLNIALENQVEYWKKAEGTAREESERYFQMARELHYQMFLLKGGQDADYQQP